MMNTIVKRNTFSILFYIVRSKENKSGLCPIYCKITVQGKPKEFSTHIWLQDKKWDGHANKQKGSSEEAQTTNSQLNAIRSNLQNIRTAILEQNKLVTAEIVANVHLNKGPKSQTLIQAHKYYNEEHIKKRIGKGFAKGTYQRFCTCLDHVQTFLKYQYKIDDMLLKDLTYPFAIDYDQYLRIEKKCCNNTSAKYIKNLKTVLSFAVDQDWLINNPIQRYACKLEKVEKGYLTEEELEKLETKEITNERLSEVRDMFIFCCYTGLAYSDIAKLSKMDITTNMQNKEIISTNRTKTNTLSNVPLLDKAKFYLKKYETHPICLSSGKLFPVKSNQKHNEYLKEIAAICGINKILTTHMARHTFGTYMLTLGAKIESISSMMGHTDIRTTQIYAKITAEKINSDMEDINRLLAEKSTSKSKKQG